MQKKKKDKLFITLIILDVLALIGFFITYGPITFFRSTLVTSAMTTQTHQYLAYIFYNDEIIAEVMKENVVDEFVKSSSNTSDIEFNNAEVTEYANEFEEQVLKRDEGNDLYKVITTKYKKNTIHLLVVYDPSRLSLVNSPKNAKGGQMMTSLAKSFDAIAAVNASGYSRNKSTGAIKPVGTIIQDGKITSENGKITYGRGFIGFNYDNVLMLTYEDAETAIENGMRDAMTFGPFLILNGEKAEMKGDGGWGYAPRTAIAQRKDGIVLFAVSDGRGKGSPGLSMVQLADFLYQYGAYNAANLDGGGSSTMVINGKLINDPGGYTYTGQRYLCNAWILK